MKNPKEAEADLPAPMFEIAPRLAAAHRFKNESATAKVVDYSQLKSEYDSWIKSRPQTRKALGCMKAQNKGYGNNTYSQYAMLKGHNAIKTKVGYNETYSSVPDRSALIYSDEIRNSSGKNTR